MSARYSVYAALQQGRTRAAARGPFPCLPNWEVVPNPN